ncbi:MAG: amidohydrolase family protein [Solirubrobacteraceae bacterium]|nr:amidohydrolase family protein [Solirubrobacteraceae bacterium]
MALTLTGTVVTADRERPIVDPGAVHIGDDGRIAEITDARTPPPAGFDAAPQIDTGGCIYPGLIDLHSHLGYNTLPLWEAHGVPYLHHDRWPDEDDPPDYASTITWPARVLGQAAAEALIKYVEIKALVGGTTAIQGAPHTTRPIDGWLLRIVDTERLPAGEDLIMCSALQQDVDQLETVAPKLEEGRVLIYHVAEGIPGSIVHDEFDDLDTAGCVQPGLIGVHATALTTEDFARWQREVHKHDRDAQATVVWSPFSNLWLYHRTTDVVHADELGVRIALGSDWSPSGTKNVLGELKVADTLNTTLYGRHFSDADLCDMVTANPGDALAVAWGPQVGILREGACADILVCARHHDDEHRNLIEATEEHVQLVLVRGTPFYGTPALMRAAGAEQTDAITVRGLRRAVAVRQPGHKDAKLDWRGVREQLASVREDPKGAFERSQTRLAMVSTLTSDGDAPLALFGDMPVGDDGIGILAAEPPDHLTIPRPDSLTHDAAFFAAVARSGPPELQPLARYYE